MSKKEMEKLAFSCLLILMAFSVLQIIELVAFHLEERAVIIVYGGIVQYLIVSFSTWALTSFVFFCGRGKEFKNLRTALMSGFGVTLFIEQLTVFLLIYLPLLDLSQTKDLVVFVIYIGSLVSLILFLPTSIPIFFKEEEEKGKEQVEEGETEE